MVYRPKKGSIIIAFVFVIMLTLTAASFFFMLGGRASLTANQLKRAQAINCAEAAIYEAFNRIRAGEVTPANWNVQPQTYRTINVPVIDPADHSANPVAYNVPVSVSITGNSAPYTVNATVEYEKIRM